MHFCVYVLEWYLAGVCTMCMHLCMWADVCMIMCSTSQINSPEASKA